VLLSLLHRLLYALLFQFHLLLHVIELHYRWLLYEQQFGLHQHSHAFVLHHSVMTVMQYLLLHVL
jgi:hypothetical protein